MIFHSKLLVYQAGYVTYLSAKSWRKTVLEVGPSHFRIPVTVDVKDQQYRNT